MTKEGIIQKVFKKYHNEPLLFYGYKNDLKQLERELISKTLNIIDSEYGNAHINVLQRLKDKLIGDIE